MKLAFITEDDETTISAHFGHAPRVVVVDTESDQREVRLRPAHEHEHDHVHLHEHGHDHHHEHGHHHQEKFAMLADCDGVVVRGMGQPAYENMVSMGLAVYATGLQMVDEALAAFHDGSLSHDTGRVHAHH